MTKAEPSPADNLREARRKMGLCDWHLRLRQEEADALREYVQAACPHCARLAKALRDSALWKHGCTERWCWCVVPGDHPALCEDLCATLDDVGDVLTESERASFEMFRSRGLVNRDYDFEVVQIIDRLAPRP